MPLTLGANYMSVNPINIVKNVAGLYDGPTFKDVLEQKVTLTPLRGPSGPTSPTPSSAAPEPVKPGTPDYYQQRYNDFVARNPGVTPPDYYLGYGQKYYNRLMSLDADLSSEGRAWRDKTALALQQAIENKRASDPEGFAELERNPEAFRKFAFSTHPAAYVNSGLYDLPVQDILVIASTPDIKDVLSQEGIHQSLITIGKLKPGDVPDILLDTGEQYLRDTGPLAFTPLGPGLEIGKQLLRMFG